MYSSTSHNLFQDQHNKMSNNMLHLVRTDHGKLQHMYMYSKLKGPNTASTIVGVIKIIDIACEVKSRCFTGTCAIESIV